MCETNCTHAKPKLFSSLVEKERVIHDKWKEEASKTNFEIVGAPKRTPYPASQNYLEYRCKTCGHVEDFQITHVRRDNAKCLNCLENKYIDTAQKLGYTLLGESGNGPSWRKYKRNVCGHVSDIRIMRETHRVADSEKCEQCFEEWCKTEADKQGLELLGKYENCGTFRLYRYKACGHDKRVIPQAVARGAHECKVCMEEEYKQMANERGLEYLGDCNPRIVNKRLFKLPCGCLKNLRIDHARRESYLCEFCDNTHYVKPSTIYLVRFDSKDFSWLKFGYAKDIDTRKQSYGVSKDIDTSILKVVPFETGNIAHQHELKIHAMFKPYRYPKKIMETYMKHNGFTECYPVEVQDQILAEMEKLVE